MDGQRIKPSAWWYGVAAAVFVGGWVVAGVVGYFGVTGLMGSLDDMTSGMEQVVVPGSADMSLTETGVYTVFYEYRSVVDGVVYINNANPPPMDCSLTNAATGADVPLSPSLGSSNYSLGSREGVSVMSFTIDQPGTYTMACQYVSGADEPQSVLAVGTGVFGEIMGGTLALTGGIFGAIGAVCFSMALALGIVVFVTIKRSQAERTPVDTGG
jgi:hypothetical protein